MSKKSTRPRKLSERQRSRNVPQRAPVSQVLTYQICRLPLCPDFGVTEVYANGFRLHRSFTCEELGGFL